MAFSIKWRPSKVVSEDACLVNLLVCLNSKTTFRERILVLPPTLSWKLSISCFRLPVSVAAYSHLSQGYLTSSCLLSIWHFRLQVEVAAYSHLLQKYPNPSCVLWKCRCRFLAIVAAYLHSSQGYITP